MYSNLTKIDGRGFGGAKRPKGWLSLSFSMASVGKCELVCGPE